MYLQIFFQCFLFLHAIQADGSQFNIVTLQFVSNQVMFLNSQHFARFGQGKFEVDIPRSVFQVGVIDELYVHDCFAIFHYDTTELFFSKFNSVVANFKFCIQIGSCQCCTEHFVQFIVAFFNCFIGKFFQRKVNFFAAVKANHAVTVEQCFYNVFFSFQASCVCTVTFFVAVFHNAPSSSVYCFKEVAFQSCAIVSSVIYQNRFHLAFSKKFCSESICCTNPIAKTYAGTFSTASAGSCPFYKTTNCCAIVRVKLHNSNVYTIFFTGSFSDEHFAQLGFFFRSEHQTFAFFGHCQCQPTAGNFTQRFIYDFACHFFNCSNC